MLEYCTHLLFQRNLMMVFCANNVVSLIRTVRNYSRPFDEILYTFGSTTADDNVCLSSTPTKDKLP